ncbi:hypothetical protein I305_02360 [Cryptococcus gattii E566]|uniref:Tyrosine specific protein phosphatases domain-containing protein n=1 Tax=Cryptococcus gattii serotype B (strain WM276 / ATCC MYA-4071) TaxID=367775 RepID=E6RBH0_CRYGW|nr:Hypothetical protein CGB_H5700W [Cryptococcus gattii WM276]ADV24136.1 Hypothetical protein CGB_H5700W [Cryptococcus gattii WM276]KIY34802.1 hypothetical protein I305_02360 [Cryptococcus gattii E566]
MSRTATATPPPQTYFPQRNATPSMRHAAPNPAMHFGRHHQHLGHSHAKKRVKSYAGSGLKKQQMPQNSREQNEEDQLEMSFEDLGVGRVLQNPNSDKAGIDIDVDLDLDPNLTPASSQASIISGLSQDQGPVLLTPVQSDSEGRAPVLVSKSGWASSAGSEGSEEEGRASPGWMGKMAMAVVNTGMSVSRGFGQGQAQGKKVQSQSQQAQAQGQTQAHSAQKIDEEQRQREWAEAENRRIHECARLCSQWPLSGYNLGKYGPNGAATFYQPQSFCNPHHVAWVMHRQAQIEQRLALTEETFFDCRKVRERKGQGGCENGRGCRAREEDEQSEVSTLTDDSMLSSRLSGSTCTTDSRSNCTANSSSPSSSQEETNSGPLSLVQPQRPPAPRSLTDENYAYGRTVQKMEREKEMAEDLREAMACSLLEFSHPERHASLTPSATNNVGANGTSEHEKKAENAEMEGRRERGRKMFVELEALARDVGLGHAGEGMDVDEELREESQPRSQPDTQATLSAETHAANDSSDPSILRTRQQRAQSYGAKRPIPSKHTSADGEEEKRRKVRPPAPATSSGFDPTCATTMEVEEAVDEVMVVEEAVDNGVIMPATQTPSPSQSHAMENRFKAGRAKIMSSSVPDLTKTYSQPASATTYPPQRQQHSQPSNSRDLYPPPAVFGVVVKTSESHPIIISPFFPKDLLSVLAEHLVLPLGGGRKPLLLGSKLDVPSLLLSYSPGIPFPPSCSMRSQSQSAQTQPASNPYQRPRVSALGNLLLSSCPGKRLRMEGPSKGRGPVCRDISTDLKRIKGEGVGCLVWLPMPDGFTPVSMELFDSQVSLIATKYTLQGINVLVHCRGGVGRAGMTACAWAIKMGFVQPHPSLVIVEEAARQRYNLIHDISPSSNSSTPIAPSAAIPAELEHQIVMSMVERVIAMIRCRRGLKAIESFEQVAFLMRYVGWLRQGARSA